MKKITRYQALIDGQGGPQHTNRGSFITNLFKAYSSADFSNRKKLEEKFPEEFINKTVSIFEENLN